MQLSPCAFANEAGARCGRLKVSESPQSPGTAELEEPRHNRMKAWHSPDRTDREQLKGERREEVTKEVGRQ